MDTTIYAIRTQEYLTPNSYINIINPNNHLVCIHFFFDAVVQLKHQKLLVPSGQLVIANCLKIVNSTANLGGYRIVVFHTNNRFFKGNIKLLQLEGCDKDKQRNVQAFLHYWDEFVRKPKINYLHQLEHILDDLMEMLDQPSEESNDTNSLLVEPTIKKFDARLLLVHRHIRNNYSKPLTLQCLADLIKSNPVYLSNTFSKVFRISPMKFLQLIRMKKALEFLNKNTDMSIKNVALSIGYISTSQFSETFKRYHGQTPQEYRNQCILLNYSAVAQD